MAANQSGKIIVIMLERQAQAANGLGPRQSGQSDSDAISLLSANAVRSAVFGFPPFLLKNRLL